MDQTSKACRNEKLAYTAYFSSLPLSLLSFKNPSKPAETKCKGLHHRKITAQKKALTVNMKYFYQPFL